MQTRTKDKQTTWMIKHTCMLPVLGKKDRVHVGSKDRVW